MTAAEFSTAAEISEPGLPRRVAIVGVGLLGGSVALSLKRLPSAPSTIGWARSSATADRLRSWDGLDQVTTDLNAAVDAADVVVVATPVSMIAKWIEQIAAIVPPTTLITDVGSTKATIVAQCRQPNFVAAHPIAGSEQSGFEHATADLFDNKPVVITPGNTSDPDLVTRCESFWRCVGGNPSRLSAETHDRVLAGISHVPHLISSLVAARTPAKSLPFVGSGWRDITRVAAGDVPMWMAIVAENRPAIADELEQMSTDLTSLIAAIRTGDDDAVQQLLQSGVDSRRQSERFEA